MYTETCSLKETPMQYETQEKIKEIDARLLSMMRYL